MPWSFNDKQVSVCAGARSRVQVSFKAYISPDFFATTRTPKLSSLYLSHLALTPSVYGVNWIQVSTDTSQSDRALWPQCFWLVQDSIYYEQQVTVVTKIDNTAIWRGRFHCRWTSASYYSPHWQPQYLAHKMTMQHFSIRCQKTHFLLSSSLKMSAHRCLIAALVEPSIRK